MNQQNDSKAIKIKLYQACESFVNNRISTIKSAIEEAQASANEETKSTAGDKHDTSRAMMQLAAEQNGKHLAEAEKLKQALFQINPNQQQESVQLGSLVQLSTGKYFISISAGKLQIDQSVYYAISPGSPIGQLLLGKKRGDQINFNQQTIPILSVI